VRLYRAEDTGPVALMRAGAPMPPSGPAMITYDVRLHQEEDLPVVQQWLETHGVSVAGAKGRKIRLYLLGDSPLADELAALGCRRVTLAGGEPTLRPDWTELIARFRARGVLPHSRSLPL
jgi:hypothetical protein